MTERILVLVLFLLGFWGIVAKRNIIKKIFGLSILNTAVVILFILEGSRMGIHAPIMEEGITSIVDPVPQALMLTVIVIGVCITALALALAFLLYRASGTFNIDGIHRKIEDEN